MATSTTRHYCQPENVLLSDINRSEALKLYYLDPLRMRRICDGPQNEVQHEHILDHDMAKHESIMNLRIWYKIHLFKIP